MQAALVCYTLLNLAILGFIVLFVRASRARAVPNERQDLEENALVAADWEMVRGERCLPSGCPRLRGQPPRPPKDVACEICAATFLAIRLQRLLDGPLATESADAESEGRLADRGMGSAHPVSPLVSQPLMVRSKARELRARPSDAWRRPAARKSRRSGTAGRWSRIRFGLGIGGVAAGAAVVAFGGLAWVVLPGYGMVLLGLGLIASSAASGAV